MPRKTFNLFKKDSDSIDFSFLNYFLNFKNQNWDYFINCNFYLK